MGVEVFVEGVCGGVCGGRLQNAPTQHTLKVVDYQSNKCCDKG